MKITPIAPKLPEDLYLSGSIDRMVFELPPFKCFDKDGFDLNAFEAYLYEANNIVVTNELNRNGVQFPWFTVEDYHNSSISIDHSLVLARFGYSGNLRNQIVKWKRHNRQLTKLLQIQPKWGFDVDIEYFTTDGTVVDVFHVEEDFFNYNQFLERKEKLEQLVITKDWEDVASRLVEHTDAWKNLTGDDENDFKAQFVGWDRAYKTKKVI